MLITELFNTYKTKDSLSESANISDVLTAREFINRAIENPTHRHEYFTFLKSLRDRKGKNYSTEVHKQASKLVKA